LGRGQNLRATAVGGLTNKTNLGVVGITEDRRICVSGLYVARNEAGRAVDELAGKPLLIPRPRQPKVDVIYIAWHNRQVFKGAVRNETTDANP
jgi:putative restriction endonuclease